MNSPFGYPDDSMFMGEELSMEELQELCARRGAPLPEGQTVASGEEAIEALRTVYDPEIPVNIYDPVSYTHLTLPTKLSV